MNVDNPPESAGLLISQSVGDLVNPLYHAGNPKKPLLQSAANATCGDAIVNIAPPTDATIANDNIKFRIFLIIIELNSTTPQVL